MESSNSTTNVDFFFVNLNVILSSTKHLTFTSVKEKGDTRALIAQANRFKYMYWNQRMHGLVRAYCIIIMYSDCKNCAPMQIVTYEMVK